MTGGSFKMGYRFQRYWDTPMALAFFCGELGAGLFVVSMFFAPLQGMVIGMLLACLGKPFFHLTHMGVPAKSWRAILRPDRSWISRGLLAIVVFTGAAGLHLLDWAYDIYAVALGATPLAEVLGLLIMVVAGLSALVIMTYQGFAMAHSSAIALWSTGLMPIASLIYALLGGLATNYLIVHAFGLGGFWPNDGFTLTIVIGAAIALVIVLSLLHAAWHGSSGGRQSAELLIRGQYSRPFVGLVIVVGLLMPMTLGFALEPGLFASAVICACILTGYLAFRILMFKAAVFEPILNLAERIARP